MLPTDASISDALNGLKASGRDITAIRAALNDPGFSGYLDLCDLPDPAVLLPLASAFSIHPISGFAVGAVAVGSSGRLYLGANMEFHGMPLNASLHAEQSAILSAWLHDERELAALHVTELPCGHCRQFLRELSNFATLSVFVNGVAYKAGALLPDAFGQIPARGFDLLSNARRHELVPQDESPEPITALAIGAARLSYVPYSQTPEGCAIQCAHGPNYTGRAAESIAFNPSLSALQTALNQRNLSAGRKNDIVYAVQTISETALHCSLRFGQNLLASVSRAELKVVKLSVS